MISGNIVLTGIEPAVLKAATAGVARAGGWGIRGIRSSRQTSKLRALVTDIETGDATSGDFDTFAAEDLASVGRYLDTPEFAHIAYSLASIAIVQKVGRKSDDALEMIKNELHASLQAAGLAAADLFADRIFAAILYAVTEETANIGRSQSPRAHAEAVKMVASIATASMRNTQLLKKYTESAEFLTFEDDLSAQVRSLHVTMKIPHAGTTRQVPYDQLFTTETCLCSPRRSR